MRKINKDFNTKPSILNGKNCVKSLKKVIRSRIIKNLEAEEISSTYYKGPNGNTDYVKENLRVLYKNKCAFCEARYDNLDVDHYRPKDAVYEENTNHPGYYWLCYEWSNLIYVCKFCNQDYKRTHFPITGLRLKPKNWQTNKHLQKQYTNLEYLRKTEKPLLLNPEEFDFVPEKYLKYSRDGKPTGIDVEGRGAKTIEICHLDRGDISDKKNKTLENLIEEGLLRLLRHKEKFTDKELIDEFTIFIKNRIPDEETEFTFFWRHIELYFEEFIILNPKLGLKDKNTRFAILLAQAHKNIHP